MIKAIVFDCFGVLTTENWHEFLSSLPDSVDVKAVRDVHRAYGAGMITKHECGDTIKELSGREFIELEDSQDSNSGLVNKNKALLGYIKELKQQYKIGLLSNIGNNWVRERFLNADEQKLFDAMAFSYEVGANKPAAAMYNAVCEKLGVQPAEVIYIDDMPDYAEAAKSLGMQAVVYENFTKLKTDLQNNLAL